MTYAREGGELGGGEQYTRICTTHQHMVGAGADSIEVDAKGVKALCSLLLWLGGWNT